MRVTTDIATDLRAILRRHGVPAGRTWGQFKEAMGVLGVTDADLLASIEYGIAQTGTGVLQREDDEQGISIIERASL